MKLQEQINRIHSMMGVIQENRESMIRSYIDKMDLLTAIKMMGGLSVFIDMGGLDIISNDEKINFIKKTVNESPNKALYFGEVYHGYKDTIIINQSKDHRWEVKALLPDKVFTHLYKLKRGGGIIATDYPTLNYENVPPQLINPIFVGLLEYIV